jgi:hypothetical protein
MLPASWQPTFLHYKQEIGSDLKKIIFWHSLAIPDGPSMPIVDQVSPKPDIMAKQS